MKKIPNYSGLLEMSKNRKTRTDIGLYETKYTDFDNDEKYTLVCENHGYLVGIDDIKTAKYLMAHPDEYCEICAKTWRNK